jgi:hypothetical protein
MNKKRLLGIGISVVCITIVSVSCGSSGGRDNAGGVISEKIVATADNRLLNGGTYVALPSGGIYLQAGQTLTLSWSADGSLEGYIFTQNQFNNFKPYGAASAYEAYSQGVSRTISWHVQNSDTYYGVVTNRLIPASSVKLYQAKLTLR